MARLNLELIESGLNTYVLGKATKANELLERVESTNERAKELAAEGASEGALVIAREQTGGKGRQGRSWVSPRDSGIFMSVILRPTLDPSIMPLISFAAAVAAAEAVERACGQKIGLKWVNDLVHEGKKLGGILAEMPGSQPQASSEHKGGWILPPAVILGLGINLSLKESELPEELKAHVASLDDICGKEIDANQLVSEFVNSLEDQYEHLRHGFHELVIAEWKKHSVTIGKQVRATLGNETFEGLAENVDDSGALVLKMDDGSSKVLHAGEISLRLEDGSYA